MSWRIVAITNPAVISLKNKQLCIKQDEEITLPIEDIDTLLIDSYGVQMSANILVALSEQGVVTIICDEKHLPSTLILSHEPHSRQLKVIQAQLAASDPFKKRIWQKIVQVKIENQAEVLHALGKGNQEVSSLIKAVQSGDVTNREAYAARLYFMSFFESGNRSTPSKINAGMNYAYAIVRGAIARHLVSYGFITSIGIHHKSELNNFNLADDLIEPFRPIIDLFVFTILEECKTEAEELTKEERMKLLDILNYSCSIDERRHTLQNAIELFVKMYSSTVQEKDLSRSVFPYVVDNYVKKNYENDGHV